MANRLQSSEFMPTFSVRKHVALFCGSYDEREMLKFLRKFEPFSRINLGQKISEKSDDSNILIKESLLQSLKFDDDNDKIVDLNLEMIKKNKIDFNDLNCDVTPNKISKYEDSSLQDDEESFSVRFYLSEDSQELPAESKHENYGLNEINRRKRSLDSNLEIRLNLANVFSQELAKNKLKRQIAIKGCCYWQDKLRLRINLEQNRRFAKARKNKLNLGFCMLEGTADGVDTVVDELLQIKLRKRDCFETRAVHLDMIEAHCFMKMYSSCSCLMVNIDENESLNQTKLLFDGSFWQNEIYDKLRYFTEDCAQISIDDFREKWAENFFN